MGQSFPRKTIESFKSQFCQNSLPERQFKGAFLSGNIPKATVFNETPCKVNLIKPSRIKTKEHNNAPSSQNLFSVIFIPGFSVINVCKRFRNSLQTVLQKSQSIKRLRLIK